MSLIIALPVFKRLELTKIFIESLNMTNKEYHLIISDDSPEFEHFNYFKEYSSTNITVLKGTGSLFWVGSINLAIKYIYENFTLNDQDIIVFANNDVILKSNTIDIIENNMKDNFNLFHPRTFELGGIEVSSGAKVISWFPYITKHPKNFEEERKIIDLGTARFLCFKYKVLKKIKYINKNLIQYQGDNDFTLQAKKLGFKTYILRDAKCKLYNDDTGLKNNNIKDIKSLVNSFYSIKSSNNIKYRYVFVSSFFNQFFAIFIVFSMTLNSILKYYRRKFNE